MKDKFASWEQAVLWLRGQKGQQYLVNSCYYDDPAIEAAERYYQSREWKAVRKVLDGREPGHVLDLGAGRGISSYAFARDGWQVTALEPDSSPVVGANAVRDLAKQGGLHISVIEGTGEDLPFESGSFDLVYGRAVLHHAWDLGKLCLETARVLKQGGSLLATREHVLSKKKDLQVFLDSHPLHSLYGGENALLLDEYLSAIANSGLKTVTVFAPYDSEINVYPDTFQIIRERICRKILFNPPDWFFGSIIVPMLNRLDSTPGRLYSFLAEKLA